MMPRFYRRNAGMAIRPVHRIKHVFDEQGAIVANNVKVINFSTTKDAPVLANAGENETGSKINGFFITVEVYATNAAALANVYFMIAKNQGGNLTFPSPNGVGVDDNKRYVYHQEMIMLQQVTNGNVRTLFKGVIAIPRHLRRNGPNDIHTIRLFAPGVNINYCIQVHWKEFR